MDLEKITQQTYDKIADSFALSRQYNWPIVKQWASTIKEGQKVLDLGCGSGRLANLFDPNKIDYLGIDPSSSLITKAQKSFPQHRFKQQNLQTFSDLGSFDAVFSIAVFHHYLSPESQSFNLAQISQLLKPRGFIYLTVWNLWRLSKTKTVWSRLFNPKVRNWTQKYRVPWPITVTFWQNNEKFPLLYWVFTKHSLINIFEKNDLTVKYCQYVNEAKSSTSLKAKNIALVAHK